MELIDTNLFEGRQETAKTLLFCEFLRFLFLFILLYILRAKKHTVLNKFLSKKSYPILQAERDGGYEERIISCMIYPSEILFLE